MERSPNEYFLGTLNRHEERLQDIELKNRKELRYYTYRREETGLYYVANTYWNEDEMYINFRPMRGPEMTEFGLYVFERKNCLPLHPRDSLKVRKRAREAIDTWTLCAQRMGISRDVRILIGKMILERRDEWIEKNK